MKHLSMKHLWIQQAVREKQLEVKVVEPAFKWRDVGTKALDAPRLQSFVSQLPIKRGAAAAVILCKCLRSRCAAN